MYRVGLNIPRGHERSADFGLVYVESSTGLRSREEWLIGSPGDAWIYHLYEYRLVPITPELESRQEIWEVLPDMLQEEVKLRMNAVMEKTRARNDADTELRQAL